MAYILLIEPNTLLARTYTKALRHAGHEVRHTTGAQTAIIAADDRAPDMIVLELQLPVHNGIEFLQEFRSYAEWQDIPIVVNTVIPPNRLADLEPALQRDYGIGPVLYKPRTSLQDLVRLVHEHALS